MSRREYYLAIFADQLFFITCDQLSVNDSLTIALSQLNSVTMKHLLLIPVFSIICIITGCQKEGEINVTTASVTNITANGAQSGGTISVIGNYTIRESGICYSTSTSPSFEDNHTSDGYGIGTFTTNLSGLNSGTTYFIRAYVNTSSGIFYGDQLEFKTKEDITLSYGAGVYKNSWGLTNGGSDEWAVMFPSSILTMYSGMKVLRVKVYSASKRDVTLKIYSGGTTSPTSLIVSKSVSLLNGWNVIDSFSQFTLNTSQSLWISLSCSYNSGEYPAAASAGVNDRNARWKKNTKTGNWYDVYDNNDNVDLCWMIQAQLGLGTKCVSLSYTPSQDDATDTLGNNTSDKMCVQYESDAIQNSSNNK